MKQDERNLFNFEDFDDAGDMFLDVAVEESISRIKKAYESTEGKIYLSFSGGKDSTVLAELIKMAELPTEIPFVFANTGIELDATYDFVKKYNWANKVVLKPRKPFGQVLKDYGKPVISKMKSENLSTYRKHLDEPFKTARARQLITGEAEYNLQKTGNPTRVVLAQKHFNFLHPDLEYPVANKCCQYMKKYPFLDYSKENDMNGTFVGVRIAEGGARALNYKSCTLVKKVGNKTITQSMPLIDWTDEMVDGFIKKYNIKLSDAYEVYGLERTGCVGCPFARDVKKELDVLKNYEPLKYKATLKWLGDVYMDMGVELPEDLEYMEKYKERSKVNEVRRSEMWEKFKDYRFKK